MSKKILFLSPYPVDKAPSQRLKYEQYFSIFENTGYDITTKSFVSEKLWDILYLPGFIIQKLFFTKLGYIKRFFTLFSIRKYDIIYVHLWVTPIGPPIFEWLTIKLAKKVVYDIDDMVFLGHSSDANKLWKNLKGKSKMIYLMKKANHVITCTPKLDEFVKQYNKNTTDISSTVDTCNRYIAKSNYQNKEQIVLGWSGSHSTSKYLYLLSNVFKELSKKHNFKLVVMGDKNFKIEGVNVEAIEWREDIEINTLQKFDIGLYPLPDEDWVYGKSGLKAIQYMALGIPTIATAIGANFRIIKNGINGFLVNPFDDEGWLNKMELLIKDVNLRKKLGKAGRKTIEKNYSIEVNKKKYLTIFNSI